MGHPETSPHPDEGAEATRAENRAHVSIAQAGHHTSTDPVDGRELAAPVGVVTRTISWLLDAVVINLVVILAGVGTALVLSIFPLGQHIRPALEVVAGALYFLWTAAYFVAFWSLSGQTPGARLMQIRLIRPARQRVKPHVAIVRWIGMNLAMIPLFAGYLPVLFGRRPLPDWMAKTLVIDMPQDSLAERGRARIVAARAAQQSVQASRPAAAGRSVQPR